MLENEGGKADRQNGITSLFHKKITQTEVYSLSDMRPVSYLTLGVHLCFFPMTIRLCSVMALCMTFTRVLAGTLHSASEINSNRNDYSDPEPIAHGLPTAATHACCQAPALAYKTVPRWRQAQAPEEYAAPQGLEPRQRERQHYGSEENEAFQTVKLNQTKPMSLRAYEKH